MTIIDQFSNFGYNFIIQNKKSETILGNIKKFINSFGKPNSIHTDNGREFWNKLIENYCKLNNINIIHGRPFHPQWQGCIESFNKQIKNLLENRFFENPKKLSKYTALPEIIQLSNERIHSSIKLNENFYLNVKIKI